MTSGVACTHLDQVTILDVAQHRAQLVAVASQGAEGTGKAALSLGRQPQVRDAGVAFGALTFDKDSRRRRVHAYFWDLMKATSARRSAGWALRSWPAIAGPMIPRL